VPAAGRAVGVVVGALAVGGAVFRAIRRRRRSSAGGGRGDWGTGGDYGGVREPRRPMPTPSGAAMAIADDGDAVQVS